MAETAAHREAPGRVGTVASVALLVTSLDRGGAERQVVYLARHLAAQGWRVEVLCLLSANAFTDALAAAEVPVTSFARGKGSVLLGLVRLSRHLYSRRPDVLVTFNFHPNVVGRLLRWLGVLPKSRLITSYRNAHFGNRTRDSEWRDRILRWSRRLDDATTVNSQRAADELASRRLLDVDRSHVVVNAIEVEAGDLPRSESPLRDLMGVGPEAFVWLAVGRLEPQKDYPTMLAALAALPEARLAIAGAGSLREHLAGIVRRLRLRDRVVFLGARDDVPALLAGCDGFLLSSAWEGLPNVLIEASAAGIPVVTTDVGGAREVVSHGEGGFVVEPNAPGELAEAMRRMMGMPGPQRDAMGRKARAHVRSRFALDTVGSEWERLLTDVVVNRER